MQHAACRAALAGRCFRHPVHQWRCYPRLRMIGYISHSPLLIIHGLPSTRDLEGRRRLQHRRKLDGPRVRCAGATLLFRCCLLSVVCLALQRSRMLDRVAESHGAASAPRALASPPCSPEAAERDRPAATRDRSRSKERDRDTDKDGERARDTSRGRGGDRERGRDREFERDRGRDRDRDKHKVRGGD